MSNRNQNQGQRGSNRNQKQSNTVYVVKSQNDEAKIQETENESMFKSASYQQKSELNQPSNNQSEVNQPNQQPQPKFVEQHSSFNQNKSHTETNTPNNKNNQPRGSQQKNNKQNNSQISQDQKDGNKQNNNRKQNVKHNTTYVLKSESPKQLSQSQTPSNNLSIAETSVAQSFNTNESSNQNKKNENNSNNNLNDDTNNQVNQNKNQNKQNESNKQNKRYSHNNQKSSNKQFTERSTVGPQNSNNYENQNLIYVQKNSLSSQNGNNFEQSPAKSGRSTYQNDKSQGSNKVFEDKNEVFLQDLAKFKKSSEEFQKLQEDKMTEFMRFHPKTSVSSVDEKHLTRDQKKKNKIIRDNRKNHSIIKSPANQLITTNWDGLHEVEQSYEFLERKSQGHDLSQSSAFGSDNANQGQYFPSLDDSARLSRFAPSSVKQSRRNSGQSSDHGKDEFNDAIQQIQQEIENEKIFKRSHFRSSNDIELSIQSEVIPENEIEDEDPEHKNQNKPLPKDNNKKQNQRKSNKGSSQRGSYKREEFVRKDQIDKVEVPQQKEKQKIVFEEKKEQQYDKVLSDEEIDIKMDLDKAPSKQKDQNNKKPKNKQNSSASSNANIYFVEKVETNNDSNQAYNELENSDEGVEQRISNLDDFIPYQMTAEEKEAFEKQYEEDSNKQQNYQQQNVLKQGDNKIDKNQHFKSNNQIHQHQEEQPELNDDPLTSKRSCQSPPPTENITTQDVDAVPSKYDDEIVNVYVDQDSPIRVRKFSKEKNEKIVKLEKQVIEQLKKENMIKENSVDSYNQDKTQNSNEIKLGVSQQQTKEQSQVTNSDQQKIKNQQEINNSVQQQNKTQVESQQEEDIFDEIDIDGHSLHKNQEREERDRQAMNGKSLDEQLNSQRNKSSPQKINKFENNIDKIVSELNQQCEFFSTHTNYASESIQDNNKNVEINGHHNNTHQENTNQVESQNCFLTQFSDNLKENGRNNAFIINSLGSNIATTFTGLVCNKIVNSSHLKNGKLITSGNQKTPFSQLSLTNISLKN